MKIYSASFSVCGVDAAVDAEFWVRENFPSILISFRVPLGGHRRRAIVSALSCLSVSDLFYCKVNGRKFPVELVVSCDCTRTILSEHHPAPYDDVNLSIARNAELEAYLERLGAGRTVYLGLPIL